MAKVLQIKGLVQALNKIGQEITEKVYFKVRGDIRKYTITTVREELRNHTVYQLLSSEFMNADLGFSPGEGLSRSDTIVNAIMNDVSLTYNKESNTIKLYGKIDYETLYALDVAIVKNNSRNAAKGNSPTEYNWLKWVLENGSYTIDNYHIWYDSYNSPPSRSTEAIMKPGGRWSVPSDISGTTSDNWITQSIEIARQKLSPNIRSLITSELKRVS